MALRQGFVRVGYALCVMQLRTMLHDILLLGAGCSTSDTQFYIYIYIYMHQRFCLYPLRSSRKSITRLQGVCVPPLPSSATPLLFTTVSTFSV